MESPNAEVGGQMLEGIEHITTLAKGEFNKDLELLHHKLITTKLVFDWHWIVGCCIALFAAVSSNIGLNLQRLSHLENQFFDPFAKVKREKPASKQTGVCSRPRWVLGICLMILASLADFAALSFAAQSLVASLGSLSLVANALIAPLIVREKITSREWKAIGLICIGDACCILFGQHKSEVYTLEALMDLYGEAPFIAYAIIMALAIVSIWFSIYWIETAYAPPSTTTLLTATTSAEDDHRTSMSSELSERSNRSNRFPDEEETSETHAYSFTYDPNGCIAKYHRFSHAMLSGILGAQSVLLGKSTAELIKTLVAGRGNLFLHLGTYVILISMVTCIVTQVHYLNEALKRVEATIVVPVFQTFWTLVSVVGGMVMYKEYHDLRFEQIMMFCVGLGLVLVGVQIMSQRKATSVPDENEENDTSNNKKNDGDGNPAKKKSTKKTQGSVDAADATARAGLARHTGNEEDDATNGHGRDDDDDDDDQMTPSENDSLLGGEDARRIAPATPSHDTHSHLASACSFPGVLIDSAARSVRRSTARETYGNSGGNDTGGRGRGGSGGGHYNVTRTGVGNLQQETGRGTVVYDDDCV